VALTVFLFLEAEGLLYFLMFLSFIAGPVTGPVRPRQLRLPLRPQQ